MRITVAVNDASVLIDLAYGDLVGHWFALGIETYVTDAVFTEVRAGGHARLFTKFVDAGLLKVDRISPDDALEWLSKVQSYAESLKISFADATALICAEEKDAILLTGDRLLRLQAEKYGVNVRGVLWVMDMLLWEEIIGFQQAIEALNEVLSHGARLPAGDCQGRLENWRREKKTKPRGLVEK